jgi:hypothetical protein
MIERCEPERGERSKAGSSGAPPGATLSERHAAYLADRAVPPDVARAAGYWTARRPSEIPTAFSGGQRRRHPTLVAPQLSPDGVSVSWQKRDDRPGKDRRGKIIKWASPPGDRSRTVLSVHPWMLDEVRYGTGSLWKVEGLTRAHALAGLGIPAVSHAGCHSWQKDGKPLRCYEHINLAGRLVYDVPDADAQTNESVQNAQEKRVAFFESRGARVFVVSVPEVNGDLHAGLDDYIAAGGDLEVLVGEACLFVPVDVGRERLGRDESLRIFVEDKMCEVGELPSRTNAECNAVKLARWMVETKTPAHGKPRERGVEIHPSPPDGRRYPRRQLSDSLYRSGPAGGYRVSEARRRSPGQTPGRALPLALPLGGGRAQSVKIEGDRGAEEVSLEHRGKNEDSLYQRGSSPRLHSMHIEAKDTAGREKVPALRNSKLVHTFIWHQGRKVVAHSDYFERYGSKREEIIRYVLERGPVEVADLHEKFGSEKSRPGRFFKTWVSPMLSHGVFAGDAWCVAVVPDWPEALERVRALTDEDEDNRRQSEKYAERQRNYHARLSGEKLADVPAPEPTPSLAGPERTAEIVAAAERRDHAARVEEQRRKVGATPETFLADALEGVSGFGWHELGERWSARGGRREDIARVVRNPVTPYRFMRDEDGWLYVERTGAISEAGAPASQADPINPEAVGSLEGLEYDRAGTEVSDDWRNHPLDCECVECDSPMPTYATAWSDS